MHRHTTAFVCAWVRARVCVYGNIRRSEARGNRICSIAREKIAFAFYDPMQEIRLN